MKYLDKLNEADQRAYAAACGAYGRYSVLKYNLSKSELAELYGPGEPTEHKAYELVLEDWAPITEKATGESVGYVTRVNGRPLAEILRKLSDRLGDSGLIVDEYFSVSPDTQHGKKWINWPAHVVQVMVYAVQGGSEGHYVHVDVAVRQPHEQEPTHTSVFLLKTFLGMEHALRLSNELTRLLEAAR